MSVEESFIEAVVPVRPVRWRGEREVGQPEQGGKPDPSYVGFIRQHLPQNDDGPCREKPQGEKTNPGKGLNPLFKTEKKRLRLFQVLSHDEGVPCNERDPSQILPAVDVLAPTQVGFEDLIGPLEHERPDSATLGGIDLGVDVIQSIQHLGLETMKWIAFSQA